VPTTPTVYLVTPAVTINRPQRDTELLCGVYVADRRGESAAVTYSGLGDNPAAYQLEQRHRSVRVSEEGMDQRRAARDHRQLVFDIWKDRRTALPTNDPRLEEILRATAGNEHQNSAAAKAMLGSLLWILADVAPVPAAIVLFAKGAAGIHNAYRAHRLARDEAQLADARAMLEEMQQRLDTLSPEQTRSVIEMLVAT
jgi:hypothetical protein